jgi:hypothetical protein
MAEGVEGLTRDKTRKDEVRRAKTNVEKFEEELTSANSALRSNVRIAR